MCGTCVYEHDLSDTETFEWDENLDHWSCPHEATHGEYCIFHAPVAEKDDEVVVKELLARVENANASERDRSQKQFLGAQFGDLNLMFATIDADDNYPLDLRFAEVDGDLQCSHAVFVEPINLRNLRVTGDATFVDVRFYSDVWFEGTTIEGDFNIFDIQFDDDGHFAEITVEGDTCFDDVLCLESMDLDGATFGGSVTADGAEFGDELEMCGTTFEGEVSFEDATFEDEVVLEQACLEDTLSFEGAEFADEVVLEQACLEDTLVFEGAEFEDDLVITNPTGEGSLVDLSWTTLSGGTFRWTPHSTVFDLTHATLGTVSLEAEEGTVFNGLHVEETTFEEFDFGSYVGELAETDWQIHSSPYDTAGTETAEDPGTVETTYTKAKNGAQAAGNDRIAAEFFRKEMNWRARGYRERLGNGALPVRRRLTAAGALIANILLDLSTGYGERPYRVVALAVGMVFGFAALFALFMSWTPYGGPIGYLVLSATSFVTLVLIGGEPIENPYIRLLAEVEGFIGAFLIALFVFTLTRSINR